ncbi:glycosyltransferase family 2 protein [Halalkalicoccus tibetensis]|uniref:Glycosyltransferase family 2 protein n=1 Tax=Halalkalicoccus tibetensis TaxID=175632 RepID=A0ABD5V768_9EURY
MSADVNHIAEKVGTILGIGGLLSLGFYTDADIWTIEIGSTVFWIFEGLVSVGLFSVIVGVAGILLTYEVWLGKSSSDEIRNGPPVQAIVPAYHDADVVHESVTSLLDSEYAPLCIAIVVEPDDERTRDRAAELTDQYETVSWIINDTPGSKATAINTAVEHSTADHFVVFDADERASPRFVPIAMRSLLNGTDVFQGRRMPRPTGPIETVAYCERVVVQAGYLLGELVGFTHCQSSATGFTREAFNRVGGYRDMLTEDIYFSHQCYRAGLTVTRNSRCTSTMEAPHTFCDLWGQRKRWRIGHVQVAHRRISEAMSGNRNASDLLTVGRSIGAVLAGGVLLVLTAHVLFLFVVSTESALLPFASIFGMIAAVWSHDAAEGRIGRPSWSIVFAPLVYLGHGVLTVKALFEYTLTWNGEWYRVVKVGT